LEPAAADAVIDGALAALAEPLHLGGVRPDDPAAAAARLLADLRPLGLTVRHAVCVVDREEGGAARLAAVGCTLTALFAMAELDQLAPPTSV
jgi:hypothetical protein